MPTFRYRLLFVGVNTVPGHPPLYAARRDAEAMSARFAEWGYDHRARHRLLVGADASAVRVGEELDQAAAAGPLDFLLIYWAGHLAVAGRKHLLATVDGGGLPLEAIGAALGRSSARQALLILDVCNVGAAHGSLQAFCKQVAEPASIAVFAAGGSDPMSREDLRRGYFTGALLEHLPRYTRGLPPDIDLLQALRSGAEQLPQRRREQAIVEVQGATSVHLPPAKAKTLEFERRARVGRQPGKLIAASA